MIKTIVINHDLNFKSKIIVINYDFNYLKNFKTVVINYGFSDTTKKTSLDITLKHELLGNIFYFKKIIILGHHFESENSSGSVYEICFKSYTISLCN